VTAESDTQEGASGGLALPAALLLVLTCALFGRALAGDFVAYDDDVYVLENPIVREGLSVDALRRAFSESRGGNWHPLTWLSHALDVELFGLEPAGHHATSVLLHGLNAALLFLLLARASGRAGAALFAAALFAVHPLRVESVAWVSERKDVLAGAFFLGACLLHVTRVQRGRTSGAPVWLLFALGAMAKPIVVTLPIALLLLDRWPLRRPLTLGALVREKAPLLLLAALVVLAALVTQSAEGATVTGERLPLPVRLENASVATGVYLRQTVLPIGLACLYPHPAALDPDAQRTLLVPALLWAAALAAALVVAHRVRARAPALGVGLLWFLVTLVPVIGLVQVGLQAHADRYTYLPSIGLALAVAFTPPPVLARRLVPLGAVALVALSVLTWRQVGVWRDSVTLFAHAARVTERNFVAQRNLALALEAAGDLPGSIAALEDELALRPGDHAVLAQLGRLHYRTGDTTRSVERLQEARRVAPEEPEYALDLATTWLAADAEAQAEAALREAAQLGADGAELHFLAGLLAQRRGDAEGAEAAYRRALERAPDDASAWNNLGEVLLATGRPGEAADAFQRTAALDPEDAGALLNLGIAREAAGDRSGAIAALRGALELAPDLSRAAARLARLEGAQ
jgi:tetratricopeptide (TPR) repeat protein